MTCMLDRPILKRVETFDQSQFDNTKKPTSGNKTETSAIAIVMDSNTNKNENSQISQISNEQSSSKIETESKNSDREYSENINYYQKYIELLKENEKRNDFRKLIEKQILNISLDIDQQKTIEEIKILEENNHKLIKENERLVRDNQAFTYELARYQHEIEPQDKEKIKNLVIQNITLSNGQRIIKALYDKKTASLNAEKEKERLSFNEKIRKLEKEKESNNDKLLQYKNYADNKISELEADIHNKVVMIEAIEKLKKENSIDQSALNFQDENNSAQLSTDINSLQNNLERYVTTLKGNIKIDNDKIQELYGKYNLGTQNLTDKILMKSVLQHHVLEKTLECVDNYLEIKDDDDPNGPYNQEKYIVYYTNKLIFLLEKFYNDHFKQDNNVIKAILTKIRQQVYGILGEFGFSEVTCENKKNQHVHPFMLLVTQQLNQLMSGYRYIKDDTKRKNVENMAGDLIKDIVRIFKFRLLAQEPKCEAHWFKNNVKINTQVMKGRWHDDCLDDCVVDICYFPLIGSGLNDLSKKSLITDATMDMFKFRTKSGPRIENQPLLSSSSSVPHEKKTETSNDQIISEKINTKFDTTIIYDNLQDANSDVNSVNDNNPGNDMIKGQLGKNKKTRRKKIRTNGLIFTPHSK
nr:14805_t:CDS:2 [Entrophospora candida]